MSEALKRLKLFIEKENISQAKLSKKLKLSHSAISNYQSGKTNINQQFSLSLKAEYNLNPDWLLHGTEPMYLPASKPSFTDEQQEKLNNNYEQVREDGRNRIYTTSKEELEKEKERIQREEEAEREKKKEYSNTINRMMNKAIPVSERVSLPILGSVKAGIPTIMDENPEGYMDWELKSLVNPKTAFWLTVEGDSMMDCNIQHGDLLLIERDVQARNGDVVIAMIEDEGMTAKKVRFLHQSKEIELIPCNPNFKTMVFPMEQVNIIGVVCATNWKRKR